MLSQRPVLQDRTVQIIHCFFLR